MHGISTYENNVRRGYYAASLACCHAIISSAIMFDKQEEVSQGTSDCNWLFFGGKFNVFFSTQSHTPTMSSAWSHHAEIFRLTTHASCIHPCSPVWSRRHPCLILFCCNSIRLCEHSCSTYAWVMMSRQWSRHLKPQRWQGDLPHHFSFEYGAKTVSLDWHLGILLEQRWCVDAV